MFIVLGSIAKRTPDESPSNKYPLSNGPKLMQVICASLILRSFRFSTHSF